MVDLVINMLVKKKILGLLTGTPKGFGKMSRGLFFEVYMFLGRQSLL